MCSLSKEQSILSRETIQNAFFFQNYGPFFDLYFLPFIKHTAERWHPHAVLLFFIQHRVQETILIQKASFITKFAFVASVDQDQIVQIMQFDYLSSLYTVLCAEILFDLWSTRSGLLINFG